MTLFNSTTTHYLKIQNNVYRLIYKSGVNKGLIEDIKISDVRGSNEKNKIKK